MPKVKVSIGVESDVAKKISDYATHHGITVSAAWSILAVKQLEQEQFMKDFPKLLSSLEEKLTP